MNLSLFGIINTIKKENFEGRKMNTTDTIIIFIFLLLFIWAICVLIIFKLPQEILILCIILLIISGPIIPLILAYIFNNKTIITKQ